MNENQIRKILFNDHITRTCFIGVFPCDRIPREIPRFPAAFVMNTDPHYKPGRHWIAVYVKSPSTVEFFDSFGNKPQYFGENMSKYFENFPQVVCNTVSLQSPISAVCGQYCVYFLYYRCRQRSLSSIVSPFKSYNVTNDIRVYNFVKKYFNVNVPFYLTNE